jgi:hypothetical protein
MTFCFHPLKGAVIAAVIVSAASAGIATAGPVDLFGERAAMRMADQKCHLFTPELGGALAMAEAQARNTALRANASRQQLSDMLGVARRRIDSLSCRSPEIAVQAGKVRRAFAAYSHMLRMNFPGSRSSWAVDKTVMSTRQETGLWVATTRPLSVSTGEARFGMVAKEGRTTLAAATTPSGSGQLPATARLVVRDPLRADQPYLTGHLVAAPRNVSQVFLASGRGPAPGGGVAFRFTDAAASALGELDPRELVTVEFVYPGRSGDRVVEAIIEVGDFAPAASFIRMGR